MSSYSVLLSEDAGDTLTNMDPAKREKVLGYLEERLWPAEWRTVRTLEVDGVAYFEKPVPDTAVVVVFREVPPEERRALTPHYVGEPSSVPVIAVILIATDEGRAS